MLRNFGLRIGNNNEFGSGSIKNIGLGEWYSPFIKVIINMSLYWQQKTILHRSAHAPELRMRRMASHTIIASSFRFLSHISGEEVSETPAAKNMMTFNDLNCLLKRHPLIYDNLNFQYVSLENSSNNQQNRIFSFLVFEISILQNFERNMETTCIDGQLY